MPEITVRIPQGTDASFLEQVLQTPDPGKNIMLGDITAADEIYIVCGYTYYSSSQFTGLFSRYFYPHLFDNSLLLYSSELPCDTKKVY
jgi:hypothetical protein